MLQKNVWWLEYYWMKNHSHKCSCVIFFPSHVYSQFLSIYVYIPSLRFTSIPTVFCSIGTLWYHSPWTLISHFYDFPNSPPKPLSSSPHSPWPRPTANLDIALSPFQQTKNMPISLLHIPPLFFPKLFIFFIEGKKHVSSPTYLSHSFAMTWLLTESSPTMFIHGLTISL